LRMRLIKSLQEEKSSIEQLSDRDILLLEMLSKAGSMTVSQIAALHPNISESTISTTITKLWRDKKVVSKTISPENQRVTNVELTDKGREILTVYADHQSQRYKALLNAMQLSEDEKKVLLDIIQRTLTVFDTQLAKDKTAAEIINKSDF